MVIRIVKEAVLTSIISMIYIYVVWKIIVHIEDSLLISLVLSLVVVSSVRKLVKA